MRCKTGLASRQSHVFLFVLSAGYVLVVFPGAYRVCFKAQKTGQFYLDDCRLGGKQ
jgi:hypothetical protein